MKKLHLALPIIFSFIAAAASAQAFNVAGTMKHTSIEGNCWYLVGEDGKNYELIGDSTMIAGLRVEDQHVSLLVEPAKGMASICMMGDIVRVVERLDLQRHPVDLVFMTLPIKGTIKVTRLGTWYVQTKEGARYEFRDTIPAKYRHIGAKVNTKWRILLNQKSTKERMDGVILPDNFKPKAKPKKNIEKKYDPR
ncbi:MAG TPA: hypothetical protein VG537_05350 [Candidatus Kapabacteria bacterium]|nr:hypothetical protein [Candidatus Kapabacteria bacterium]